MLSGQNTTLPTERGYRDAQNRDQPVDLSLDPPIIRAESVANGSTNSHVRDLSMAGWPGCGSGLAASRWIRLR